MKLVWKFIATVMILFAVQIIYADFGGRAVSQPLHAISPDGKLLVRIETPEQVPQAKVPSKDNIVYYAYDKSKDAFIRQSSYELKGRKGSILYVTNTGELIMVSQSESGSIALYSNKGELTKSWDLEEFLTKEEIEACAQTGSTLQWFDEGTHTGDSLYFRGPSHLIRSVKTPYTVMRGANLKKSFSGYLNIKQAKISMWKEE